MTRVIVMTVLMKTIPVIFITVMMAMVTIMRAAKSKRAIVMT